MPATASALVGGSDQLLGSGKVPDNVVFLNFVDHDLKGQANPGQVELHGLIDCPFLLLRFLVAGQHFHRVPAAFGVGLSQDDGDLAHALGLSRTRDLEVEIVAFAQEPQRLQLFRVGGDIAALHAQITCDPLQFAHSLLQFVARGSDVALDVGEIGRYAFDLGAGRSFGLLDLAQFASNV